MPMSNMLLNNFPAADHYALFKSQPALGRRHFADNNPLARRQESVPALRLNMATYLTSQTSKAL